MRLRRTGAWNHPCAPWIDVHPDTSRRLFPGGFGASEANLQERGRLLKDWKAPNGFSLLVDRLRREQGPAAAQELERVGAGEPVVLTGQQPSFAGGPMFVWLKAWSAVAHAERASQLLGRPVRALFWIAGDDSDLAEVRSTSDPLARKIFDSHPPHVLDNRQPAGTLPFDPAHRDAVADEIGSVWIDSALPAMVRSASDLSALMLSCLRRWFGDRLLVIDAAWPETRVAGSEVYRKFASSVSGVHSELSVGIERARAAGLPVSIRTWPDRLRLFHLSERGRVRIAAEGDGWTDGVETWTDSSLLEALGRDGASFSHDVVSRPFAAEAVFPVLAHVLGPGECAYFACLGPLSSRMGSLAPVLPRASATLLPAGPWPLAEEARWNPLGGHPPAFRTLSDALLSARTPNEGLWPKLWADARADYIGTLANGAADPTALDGLSRNLEAFEARWRRVRIRATAPVHASDLDELRRLVAIAGEGGLQERLWSPWALEHHLGDPSLLHRLEDALDPVDTGHAVFEIG